MGSRKEPLSIRGVLELGRHRQSVDAKDFRLLVALDEDARQSFHALGRKVSLSAPAVRDRIRRLEERGIVQGYWVSIVPAVFGRRELTLSVDGGWSRDGALKAPRAP